MLYNVIVIIIIMLLLLSEPGYSVAPVADGVSGPGHRIIDRLKGGDDIFHLIYSSLHGASNYYYNHNLTMKGTFDVYKKYVKFITTLHHPP